MCHFDNFDIDQIASKLAQRWNFVHSFYCKKISVLDSFDNAKNAKRHLFFGHPISWSANSLSSANMEAKRRRGGRKAGRNNDEKNKTETASATTT